MAIERVNVSTGQVPTEADWEDWFNRAIDKLNAGITPDDLVKNSAGRVEINIAGDATTLNGKTADEIAAGDFPEVKKTLIDLITGGSGLVLKGGLATKNATIANQLDITACTVIQKVSSTGYIDRVDLPAASKTTTLANTTYYLDVIPGTVDYSWGTSHPAGDYVTLATVTTDASANIATVLDTRPLTATLLNGFDGKIIVPGANVSGDISGGATATQANLNAHKTAATLDHPDGSVIAAKLASGAALANLADGSISDAKIGNRTVDPATATAYSLTGTLTQHLSWIVKNIKALKGVAGNWYDAASATIEALWGKFHETTGHKHTGAPGDGPPVEKWGGHTYTEVGWVVPGDTLLLEALTERKNNLSSYSICKKFLVPRPGKYRITGELKSEDGTTSVDVIVQIANIDGSPLNASTAFSTTSSTYVSFTLDMTLPASAGGLIAVAIKGGGDSAKEAFVRNVRVKYGEGAVSSASVITD